MPHNEAGLPGAVRPLADASSPRRRPGVAFSCTAFGGSREWVYRYLRSHSGTPSAEFLELTRETLADIMMTASMNKAADPATVIFSLKNLHGFADRVEIMPKAEAPGPLGPLADQKALEARILGTVVDESDDE